MIEKKNTQSQRNLQSLKVYVFDFGVPVLDEKE